MRMIAGAILILAAAVSLAGAVVANALCTAAGRSASPGWPGYVAGLVASVAASSCSRPAPSIELSSLARLGRPSDSPPQTASP
jgi:hypothetical protein